MFWSVFPAYTFISDQYTDADFARFSETGFGALYVLIITSRTVSKVDTTIELSLSLVHGIVTGLSGLSGK